MGKDVYQSKRIQRYEKQKRFNLPIYSLCEEIFNAITHGLGVVFAIVSAVLLFNIAPKNFYGLACLTVYEITIFLLYIVSTLYHALGIGKAKHIFRILDHCSIFLAIAGTYTPICFFRMGNIGLILLAVIWITAITGIVFNSIDLNKYSKLSMICYIAMGWAVIFTIKPLIASITNYQLALLVSGGIVYTIGAVLYGLGKKVKYIHMVWHIFVLAGSILHFIMIYTFFI